MMICYGNSIEEVLRKNLDKKENEPIIGVGVDVAVKHSNNEKLFFYKTNLKYLYKKDLNAFITEEDIKNNQKLKRYVVATKAYINMVIDQFQEKTKQEKFVTVLENNWYTKKLINADIIQEVQGFIFDPQEKLQEV